MGSDRWTDPKQYVWRIVAHTFSQFAVDLHLARSRWARRRVCETGNPPAQPYVENVTVTDFIDRYATLTDPLAAYDAVVDAVGRLVAAVTPDQLDDTTPCAPWNVRDVLNHLVETLDVYGALAAGTQPTAGDTRVYDDPAAAFPTTAAHARAAFAAPGYLDTVAPTPIGPQPGRAVVQHVVSELTVHGWDLARGTGRSVQLPPEIADAVLRGWQAFFAEWDRAQMSANFAEQQLVPAEATALDRLAAYLGRTV